MFFQSLDDKRECVSYYSDRFTKMFDSMFKYTWDYAQHLQDKDVTFVSLFSPKKSLVEQCPESKMADLQTALSKLRATKKSLINSKVDTRTVCVYDLIPRNVLESFCEVKNEITKHVLENTPKPKCYDLNVKMAELCSEIEYQKLNIDKTALSEDLVDPRARSLLQATVDPYIKYDFFKSKTGRATTQGGFSILNLDKKHRGVLKPVNDYFVELDYNAAEARVFWALMGEKQTEEDLHEWNRKTFFPDKTRDEAKKEFFAWLYNNEARNPALESFYNKEIVLSKYWADEKFINHPYGVELECDEYYALNYVIQNTMSCLFCDRAHTVYKFLRDKKSFLSFLLHDSIVVDLAEEDRAVVTKMVSLFSNTNLFGDFKINLKIGRNFGDMRKVE